MWDLIFEPNDHEFEEEESVYEMVVNPQVTAGDGEAEEEEDGEEEEKEWDPLGRYVNAVYKKSGKKKERAKEDLSWIKNTKAKDTYFVLVNQSGRTIKQGEEVTRSYGRMSNASLLVYYSFAYVGNKYDSYDFSLEMRPLGSQLTDLICFNHSRVEGV